MIGSLDGLQMKKENAKKKLALQIIERLKAEYPEMHAEELAQRSGFSSVSAYYMNRRRYAHHSEKK